MRNAFGGVRSWGLALVAAILAVFLVVWSQWRLLSTPAPLATPQHLGTEAGYPGPGGRPSPTLLPAGYPPPPTDATPYPSLNETQSAAYTITRVALAAFETEIALATHRAPTVTPTETARPNSQYVDPLGRFSFDVSGGWMVVQQPSSDSPLASTIVGNFYDDEMVQIDEPFIQNILIQIDLSQLEPGQTLAAWGQAHTQLELSAADPGTLAAGKPRSINTGMYSGVAVEISEPPAGVLVVYLLVGKQTVALVHIRPLNSPYFDAALALLSTLSVNELPAS